MPWLKEHGLISNYDDYVLLPIGVLEDCRLVMQAENRRRREQEARRGLRR